MIGLVLTAIGFMAGPALAQDDLSPLGHWQVSTGDARYDVVSCGDDVLCARLSWLRDDARTEENLLYLNTYVVQGARQVAENKWEGIVMHGGDRIDGSIVMLDNDTLKVTGCQFLCQSFSLTRL